MGKKVDIPREPLGFAGLVEIAECMSDTARPIVFEHVHEHAHVYEIHSPFEGLSSNHPLCGWYLIGSTIRPAPAR